MGFQNTLGFLIPLSFLLFTGCNHPDPSKPEVLPPVPEEAKTFARFIVKGLCGAAPALYRQDELVPDTTLLDARFTDEFFTGINLEGFATCYEASAYLDSCANAFLDSSTVWGINRPADYRLAENHLQSDTFFVKTVVENPSFFPSSLLLGTAGLAPFAIYSGCYGTYEGSLTPQNFDVTFFRQTVYPIHEQFDSLWVEIFSKAAGQPLSENSWPDTGTFHRVWMVKSSEQSAFLPFEPAADQRLFLLELFVAFSKSGGVLRVDSVFRSYGYRDEYLFSSFGGGRFQAKSKDDVSWVHGTMSDDTAFVDTFSSGRTLLAHRSKENRFNQGRLEKQGNTLLVFSLVSNGDSLRAVFDSLYQSGGEVTYVTDSTVLRLTDSSVTGWVLSASYALRYGRLAVFFSVSQNGTDIYTGDLFLNPFSCRGKGIIRGGQGRDNYGLTVNLAGDSYIEDLKL